MSTLDFKWYEHGLLHEQVYAIPVLRKTLYRINTWLKKQGFDSYVTIDDDGYIQYTEKGFRFPDVLWLEGSYLALLDNKEIVFISSETFDRVFDTVYEVEKGIIMDEGMSDHAEPNIKSMPFDPSMINKVIQLELRGIADDRLIHHSAGILKLYTYRDSFVHYRMEEYGEAAKVDLDLYYFSILRVV